MIIALFLFILAVTLGLGAWLATRWARADQLQTSILATERRACAVNDAAEMAETACDWGGSI